MKDFDPHIFMMAVRHEAGEKAKTGITLKDCLFLLRQKDEAFVRLAYHMFFLREPDPSGFAEYLPRAASLPGRIKLLAVFYMAPERKYLPIWLRRLLEAATRLLHCGRRS